MLSSSRCLVHLEGAESFPLYRKELVMFGISEGAELSEDSYRRIMEELLTKRARRRVMYLLQKMDRTEYQLRKKLQESHYPALVIEDAIAYVKGFH